MAAILAGRGYGPADVKKILSGEGTVKPGYEIGVS